MKSSGSVPIRMDSWRCLLALPTALFVVLSLFAATGLAQDTPKKSAVLKSAEKVNEQTRNVSETTRQVAVESEQIAGNIRNTAEQVQAVVKIFEPILSFRLKRQTAAPAPETSGSDNSQQGSSAPTTTTADTPAPTEPAPQEQPLPADGAAAANNTPNLPMIPESPAYNPDGSANLGNQHHEQFGCYLDLRQGAVLDDVDAASNTGAVDLIYTATDYFGSAPMFALLSPACVKNDLSANYYFRGPKYKDPNLPVRQWTTANESGIALAPISALQFDKVRDNNQLMAVVRQCPGFKDRFESRTRLDGKVFAVKTEMANRTVYALLHVAEQIGGTGTSGYLRLRLKVMGLDANGDGMPDPGLYRH